MAALFTLATMVLLFTSGTCMLRMRVTPRVLDLDTSPSFAINCALVDSEELKVFNMSISRQALGWNAGSTGGNPQQSSSASAEEIASLSYLSPSLPSVAADSQRLTVQGQITMWESEMGSYLNLKWTSPTMDDLGAYTCSATVLGESGRVESFTAVARVTTSNPTLDRLLVAVYNLKTEVRGFNSSLGDLVTRVDESASRAASESRAGQQNNGNGNGNGNGEQEAEAEQEQAEAEAEAAEAEEPRERSVEELFGEISAVLQNMNISIASLEQRFAKMEADEAAEENETEAEDFFQVREQIQDWFTTGNSSYYLVRSTVTRDAMWAQAACRNIGLSLAEVDTEQTFQEIAARLGPIMNQGTQVVVAGQTTTYPDIGEDGSFIGSGLVHPDGYRAGDCLVLAESGSGQGSQVSPTFVPCSSARVDLLYLCEDFRSDASGQ